MFWGGRRGPRLRLVVGGLFSVRGLMMKHRAKTLRVGQARMPELERNVQASPPDGNEIFSRIFEADRPRPLALLPPAYQHRRAPPNPHPRLPFRARAFKQQLQFHPVKKKKKTISSRDRESLRSAALHCGRLRLVASCDISQTFGPPSCLLDRSPLAFSSPSDATGAIPALACSSAATKRPLHVTTLSARSFDVDAPENALGRTLGKPQSSPCMPAALPTHRSNRPRASSCPHPSPPNCCPSREDHANNNWTFSPGLKSNPPIRVLDCPTTAVRASPPPAFPQSLSADLTRGAVSHRPDSHRRQWTFPDA